MNETSFNRSRRRIITKSIYGLGAFSAMSLLGSCKNAMSGEITAVEDLMREHGIIRRIMLIYDACRLRLIENEPVDPQVLVNSGQIIRNYIENYHEKLEENFLFPEFNISNKLTDLTETLKVQHRAGRTITDLIMKNAGSANEPPGDPKKSLIDQLANFNIMYRAHAAREDTVLFPAVREILSDKKYKELGEEFENQEKKILGKNGFANTLKQIEEIEKSLEIFELDKYNR